MSSAANVNDKMTKGNRNTLVFLLSFVLLQSKRSTLLMQNGLF